MKFREFVDALKARIGIHRDHMPQIPKVEYENFLKFCETKGIRVDTDINVKMELLIPVQNTFKDLDYDELKAITDMTRPLIISRDQYIIDGHHRYLVALFDGIHSIKCTMINLNVDEALALATEFANSLKETK